jgi:hypothetical protein
VTLLREQGVGLQSGDFIEIPPGKRSISCLIKWRLPPDSVMFAVVSARLGSSYRGQPIVWSDRVVFLLESEPGVLDALIASKPTDKERAALLLSAIERLQGQRSVKVERLLRMLRELAG